MKKKAYLSSIPINKLSNQLNFNSDYEDAFSIDLSKRRNLDIDFFCKAVFASIPNWSIALFKLRNALVKPFGLSGGDILQAFEQGKNSDCRPGSKLGFFSIILKSDSELVTYDEDKHLNFTVNFIIEENQEMLKFTLITIVKFNNKGGNFYFSLIKPFHKLIVKGIMNNVKRYYNEHQ